MLAKTCRLRLLTVSRKVCIVLEKLDTAGIDTQGNQYGQDQHQNRTTRV